MNTKPIYAIETIYGEDYKVRAENEKQALKICGELKNKEQWEMRITPNISYGCEFRAINDKKGGK